MARDKKPEEKKEGAPEWMSTYGDMVTLLLTFFILLFSMSSMDVAKFKAIAASFQGSASVLEGGTSVVDEGEQVGGGINQFESLDRFINKTPKQLQEKKRKELEEIKEELEKYLEEKGLLKDVELKKDDNYVKLNFVDDVLFDSGKAVIKDSARRLLDSIADKLKTRKENRIRIEGHTDNIPMNTPRFPSNWELSAGRAISVAKYYINKGFDPRRFSAEGFGKYKPIDTNNTVEGRSKNRRVEIKIISQYVEQKME